MFTNTKSVKCSIAFAMAWQTLALKSNRNCSSSVAVAILFEDLPLDSVRIDLSWVCIFCWTLRRQRLNPAAWLHITEDSLADLSHFLRFSCDIGLDRGGFEAMPACRAIVRQVLFNREDPVCQDLTESL